MRKIKPIEDRIALVERPRGFPVQAVADRLSRLSEMRSKLFDRGVFAKEQFPQLRVGGFRCLAFHLLSLMQIILRGTRFVAFLIKKKLSYSSSKETR